MDIYCPRCAEPVEIDFLHDVADEQDTTFDAVYRAFRRTGCVAIGASCNPEGDTDRAAIASVLYDVLGDDVDGVASTLSDLW